MENNEMLNFSFIITLTQHPNQLLIEFESRQRKRVASDVQFNQSSHKPPPLRFNSIDSD